MANSNSDLSFRNLKSFILTVVIFAFPLFFLPITQEFFITNKSYLLTFAALALIAVSTFEILTEKKLTLTKEILDLLFIAFPLTLLLSLIFVSPNKFQALLNSSFGLVSLVSIVIIALYLRRCSIPVIKILFLSCFFLSLITIGFFFQPFQKVSLPAYFLFLKNPYFTPMGSQLDLAVFLLFMIFVQGLQIVLAVAARQNLKKIWYVQFFLVANLIAFSLALYQLFLKGQMPSLPTFRLSWFAFIETLKTPLTLFFGIGLDNFAAVFSKVKDFTYNQSNLWQISSFNVSRSALLQVFTETGLVGGLVFLLTFVVLLKKASKEHFSTGLIVSFLLLLFIFLPISLPLLFLIYIVASSNEETREKMLNYDLSDYPFVQAILSLSLILFLGGSLYFSGRWYLAEYYFKKSIDGLVNNNLRETYDNLRQAIILHPYIERFRVNFSQTNLLIVNNIITLANQKASKSPDKKAQLSPTERETITQAIQAAINEGKAAVTLNPQKSGNWENLASIYRNLLFTVQGADGWTISSYQRAILLDPQNPSYRISLGGVFYSLNGFDDAIRLFEQAVGIKPDLANASYNLAWANYQKGEYQRAYLIMQNVLSLIDFSKEKADYEKAQKDLEEFRKKLPSETPEATPESAPQQVQQLSLPTPPAATVEPRLNLPKEASPEAR